MVYGDWLGAPGKPTLLLYGHYDVQPEDPIDQWESPPFEATIRGENLYARGAADDKGQIFIHLKAIEAFLKNGGALPVNIKIMFEGEEEIGSDHLGAFVAQHKELLKADVILISDSGMFAKGVPSVTYALRGLAYMEVEVTGPMATCTPGSFGGSIHNPIQALTEMIASLHDKNGRITVKGNVRRCPPADQGGTGRFPEAPLERQEVRKVTGRQGTLRREGIHHSRTALGPADSGMQWHLGRLHGRGDEDRAAREGFRQDIHAAGSGSILGKDRQVVCQSTSKRSRRKPSM